MWREHPAGGKGRRRTYPIVLKKLSGSLGSEVGLQWNQQYPWIDHGDREGEREGAQTGGNGVNDINR